jgi:hypothetical protein
MFIAFLSISATNCFQRYLGQRPLLFPFYQFSLRSSPVTVDNALESVRENLKTPSDAIMNAVDQTRTFRLTIRDAASLSGLSLYTAKNDLMTLSTLTGGDLEVTGTGDIIYSFPRNYRSILNQRSIGQKLKNAWRFIFPKLFYFVRISVGLALLASITAALTAFFVVSSSSNSSGGNAPSDTNKNDKNNGGSRLDRSRMVYIDVNLIFDLFRFTHHSGGEGTPGFLQSFFSFVFGDEDPNKG